MACNLICTIIWLSCAITISVCVTTLEQGPQNKTVFVGESTSLLCDFSDDNEKTVIWTRVDSRGIQRFVSHGDLIYPQSDVDPDNYLVNVDDEQQTYELVFYSAQVVPDDSLYQCGYQYGQNTLYKPLATAYLTVLPQEYSFTCDYLHLPPPEVGASAEVEVSCVWNRDVVALRAAFQRNGEDMLPDVMFPDRIIGRTKLSSVNENVMLSCTVVFDLNDSMRSVTKSCSNSDRSSAGNRGIIRVDPFINEVALGSDAVFSCTNGDQSSVQTKFWNIVNMTNIFLSVGDRINNGTRITISNVHKEDENLLVECRAILQGDDVWVSSFATIRVVSSSTTDLQSSLRPTSRYEITTINSNSTIEMTKSPNATGRTRKIIVAIILIFLVIVTIVIIIVVLMRRRKRSLSVQANRSKPYSITYGTNSSKNVPHVSVNEGQLTYAVSFKDKRARNGKTIGESDHCRGAPEGSSTGSMSELTKVRHGQRSEPSGNTMNNISRFRSLPGLDDTDYEIVSHEDVEECQVPRSRSMTSLHSSSSNRRWTSQKLRMSTLRTPPRGRRALSYRKPSLNNDPHVSSEYAQMSIKSKAEADAVDGSDPSKPFPVYAKPDKTKKTNRHKKTREHKPNLERENSYAISAITSRDSSDTCNNGGILNERPSHLAPPHPTRFMKKDIKGTSLYGASLSSSAPPKPKRGKCQSQFLGDTAYSVVSDYEIMAHQSKIKNQNDVVPINSPKYDTPQRSFHQKTQLKDSKSEIMTDDRDHGNDVYETVDDVGKISHANTTDMVASPQYAAVDEVV